VEPPFSRRSARRRGATRGPSSRGEILLFLEDDTRLLATTPNAYVEAFSAPPGLGPLQPRVGDPRGRQPRHWGYRVRVATGRGRSGDTRLGERGCGPRESVLRRRRLAGRILLPRRGRRPRLAGTRHRPDHLVAEILAFPPADWAARHSGRGSSQRTQLVWLAHRHQPPVAAPLLTVCRCARLRACARSRRCAVLSRLCRWTSRSCGRRRRLRWAKLWRMTRLTRAPVV
jgi:hypothetical protein